MADEENLVSEVKVEGSEESAAAIEAFADRGAAAYDKLGAAAKKAGVDVGASGDRIAKGASGAGQAIGAIPPVPAATAKSLKDVESAAAKFTGSLRPLTQGIGRFVSRLALLTTGAAAAGTAFAAMASKMAQGSKTTETALDGQVKSQMAANDASAGAQTAAINTDSAIRKLSTSAQKGEISWQDYGKAVQKVKADAEEANRVYWETVNAQERAKEANDRLQKSLANQKANAELVDKFGGPMVTSLQAFGNAVEVVRKDFIASFGPGASALIDAITDTLSKNAGAIGSFFSEAGAKLTTFMTANAPAIEKAFENIGSAAKGIFEGALAAGPAFLSFFNDQLVPAIKAVGGFFDGLAAAINKTFGTNITGGFIILLVLLAQLSGAFRLFFGLLKTGAAAFNVLKTVALAMQIPFAPFLIILGLVAAALYLIATNVDWTAFGAKIAAFVAAAVAKWQAFRDGAVAAKNAIVQAWTDLITWFTELPGKIGQFFTDLWESAKQLGADAAQWVIDKWTEMVTFFSELPGKIGQFFIDLWESVKQSTIDAFEALKQTVKGWVDSVLGFLKPVLDAIKAVNASTASGGGGSKTGSVKAATGGHIRGPGTGTSDSIAAWLSNNEYVVKAKSVAKYGVGFMHAINSGKFRMPKFSGGGLNMISRMPRTHYADGGPVQTGNMRPLSLSLFGEQFDGLMMPDNVADRMTKFAIGRQTRSAGRKPAWVGGTR